MLLSASAGLLLPTMLSATQTVAANGSLLLVSRISALFMLALYVFFLTFQLKTHQELYEDEDEEEPAAAAMAAAPAAAEGGAAAPTAVAVEKKAEEEEGGEEEEIHLSLYGSIAWLTGITACVAYISELLVGSIEGAASTWGLPMAFISAILLPVAGNAAEHASAIIFAAKNRLDVTLGIAIGSATQIAMFGIPLLVTIGWIWNFPLDLDFQVFEVGCIIMSVLMASFIMLDGQSHWMQGALLLITYCASTLEGTRNRPPPPPNPASIATRTP